MAIATISKNMTTVNRDPDDTAPITLKEACEVIFNNRIGVDALRAEAARGRLSIFRIGRRDFTTIRDVREMVEKCRDAKPRPASTSTRKEKPGSSGTARDSSARAALDKTLRALRLN